MIQTENEAELKKIQKLVGDITYNQLKYVDTYVGEDFGIFIPSVGQCGYAVTKGHTHPAFLFVLFFSDKQTVVPPFTIKASAQHYLVTTISSDIPHEEHISDEFTRYVAMMVSNALFETVFKQYSEQMWEYNWSQFTVDREIMVYIKKFMSEYENKSSGYEEILHSLSVIITHFLVRGLLHKKVQNSPALYRFEIDEAVQYMHRHFEEKLTVAGLAEHVNMSPSHFTGVFKKECGLPPMDYLINIRIDKAKKLIRADQKPLTEIALRCGFNSLSHFSVTFSKHIGMTPSEYRAEFIGKQ